ncbi:MAG: glucokinase [Desulfobacterales bacterium]|nr:glucokinase [Desulfobacterales bacterium]
MCFGWRHWRDKNELGAFPPQAITEAALTGKNAACVQALNIFVSIFGAAAGNFALTGAAMGGVYLGGGISPKILPKLTEGIFMEAFINKGRFKTFLEQVPVKVVLNDKAALIGAAYCAGSAL